MFVEIRNSRKSGDIVDEMILVFLQISQSFNLNFVGIRFVCHCSHGYVDSFAEPTMAPWKFGNKQKKEEEEEEEEVEYVEEEVEVDSNGEEIEYVEEEVEVSDDEEVEEEEEEEEEPKPKPKAPAAARSAPAAGNDSRVKEVACIMVLVKNSWKRNLRRSARM